jgi:hypothetical protein
MKFCSILGGDAALQGMAVEADVLLLGNARPGVLMPRPRRADLRLDDVDAGHLLGDGMLDLDAD